MAIQEKLMSAVVEYRIYLAVAAAIAAAAFSLASLGPTFATVAGFFWPLLVSTAFLLVVIAVLFRISPPPGEPSGECEELLDFVAGKPGETQFGGCFHHDDERKTGEEASTTPAADEAEESTQMQSQ
ncbi:hypothetical protein Cni_G19189 [Canna indica]|uniref:Uncharacterized protein n=1 Tax=Canna indica TaxID=4628 RepID=A0AAQ3KKN2_9LILI|nr:hypothetical protein Cni_G19189 [Canna indica]